MTIDEAIIHAKETSKREDMCEECRQEHKQIADWLEELVELRMDYDKMYGTLQAEIGLFAEKCDRDEWVKCSDKLPKPCEWVLVYWQYDTGHSYEDRYEITRWYKLDPKDKVRWVRFENRNYDEQPIAWKPIDKYTKQ